MTGYHSFLLLAALAQGLHAVHWTGGPQNGDVIYACQGTKVTLPWHLQLGPGDDIKVIEWFYRGLSEEVVGVLIHGAFMAYPSFADRVSHVENAGIILSGLIPADSGNYTVEVIGSNATGHIFQLRQLVTVKIFDDMSGVASCNFELGMCSWTQDKTDNFDWTRNRRLTATSGTGPSADHTSGHGFYLYIETSERRYGDTARLISPMLRGTPTCLSLWYSMYGTGIGNLTVYARAGITPGVPLFTRSKNQGPSWHKASVDINTNRPFQVVIEASRGTNYLGDIAIDDVSVSSGHCHATRAQRDGLQ